MPEMLSPSAALVGVGLGKDVALVTDGRFSGASHGQQGKQYVCMHSTIYNQYIRLLRMRLRSQSNGAVLLW